MGSLHIFEEKIVTLLKREPQSVSQLAKKLNMRRDFLAGYLESMKDRGLLRLIKIGKSHVYLPFSGGLNG
ncbi:MAG: helix-turn-helix domain-containing protein [Candidatus Aenigmarchaeota archaeon]